MPLGMIFRRIWRERRLLSVLLLAICLVTGFFALGPLYVRAVSEAGIRYAVENTAPEDLNITLNNRAPFGPAAFEILDRELGGVVQNIVRITRSSSSVPGFQYQLGQPVTNFTGRTDNQYQMISYSNMEAIFTVVEGRWPVRLATPDQVAAEAAGLSADELADRQLGLYSRGQVEAVITAQSAAEANVEIGNRVIVGVEPEQTAIVRIVGIVEPALDPEDPFWHGQRAVLDGEFVPISIFEERYDFALIVPEGAYDDWVAPAAVNNTYEWRMETDPDLVHADTLDALETRLNTMQSELRAQFSDVLITSGMINLITRFREGLAETEGPIVLLSGAVLILMLYHLVTTVALVLEQQGTEWAAITSRGGSIPQLIGMQALTMGLLGVIGAIVGPFIAVGILLLLERFGPLAQTLGGASLGVSSLPADQFVLSGAAALSAVLVLTLPAWPAARRSLLRLKQMTSRPPTRPAWARYFLDFILLGLGLAFMLRLYFLISGDVATSLDTLLHDPAALIRQIASGAADAGGLNDPFNLLGPALVLTGAALLWLRFFPLLMSLFAWLSSRRRGLTVPMAMWNVARDPGHYAQLVLLLIGTLALGTASLALAATRDVGAWTVAQAETGAYARLTFDPGVGVDPAAALTLPDVAAGEALLVTRTPTRAGRPDTILFGVEPDTFAATFPTLTQAVQPLGISPDAALAGIALPDDARALSLQVYAQASDDLTTTALNARLLDAVGIPVMVPLMTADATGSGRWMTYTADLPANGQAPWHLVGLAITSRRGDLQDFSHVLYVDVITVSTADGETVIEDFESEGARWQPGLGQFRFMPDLDLAWVEDQAADGTYSLRIEYRIRQMGGSFTVPAIEANPVQMPVVPLVVSQSFADYYGGLQRSRQPLEVGQEDELQLDLAYGSVTIPYRVVRIVEDFPTADRRELFAIADIAPLRPIINATASLNDYYDINQAWLTLDERQPSDAFQQAAAELPGLTGTAYAWERYNEIQRDPLPNSITGMLFAGFWVSLLLSVLDFAFYLAVTARRRAVSFAVLQSMGWQASNLWSLLAVEQTVLVAPALLVGVALGAGLAYLLLPFMALIGGEVLRFPVLDVLVLLAVLVIVFVLLLIATAQVLRRQQLSQVLRAGEE